MKKLITALLMLTLALSLTSALAESPTTAKDSMTIVLDREPVSLDPVGVYVNVKSLVDNCIYDTLIKIDNDGNTVPCLA